MKKFLLFLFIGVFLFASYETLAAGGGGGGSGSGGGGGGSEQRLRFTSDINQISNNIKEEVSKTVTLSNGREYKIAISSVNVDNAVIIIQDSDSIKIPLGGDKEVDLDNDGVYHLKILLNSVSGRTGNFAFRELRGNERRSTKMIAVANVADRTASGKRELPEQASRGKGLKCGHLSTVRERVDCRLKLERDELYEENELLYLPEECRALEGDEQDKCIENYQKTQRCWKFPVGDARINCVKENLKLKTLKEEKESCKNKTGDERKICVNDYKKKAFDLVKFRFYDLEERAEELKEKEIADEEDVINLVSALEEKKAEFNNTSTIKEKKRIILEVRQLWKDFVRKVKK